LSKIFILIRRSSVLLLFLLLQGISISMLVKYNKSQQAKYFEVAYEITGKINKKYSSFTNYFGLGDVNRRLAAENNRLHNIVSSNFTFIDTTSQVKMDTAVVDSSRLIRKYLWRNARVINNTVSSQNNYLTLERGRKQGIEPDMAVMGSTGIVGRVTDVSDNMCIVMSLLHRKSTISVSLKNSGNNGSLTWDGVNPALLQLSGISKSNQLKVGDTILTSNISRSFPPGLMVGTIASATLNKGGNDYLIQVKPGTNFSNVQQVEVIENLLQNEQQELESRGKKRE
jgi:rod shape-determining protein MreC